jgi:hypothetical protein
LLIHLDLNRHEVLLKPVAHLRVLKGGPVHLLARHAPVGVEVDHDGLALGLGVL